MHVADRSDGQRRAGGGGPDGESFLQVAGSASSRFIDQCKSSARAEVLVLTLSSVAVDYRRGSESLIFEMLLVTVRQ